MEDLRKLIAKKLEMQQMPNLSGTADVKDLVKKGIINTEQDMLAQRGLATMLANSKANAVELDPQASLKRRQNSDPKFQEILRVIAQQNSARRDD